MKPITITAKEARTASIAVRQQRTRLARILETYKGIEDPAIAKEWLFEKGWDLEDLTARIDELGRTYDSIESKRGEE